MKDKTVGIEARETTRNENSKRSNICISQTAGPVQKITKNSKWRVKTFCSLCNKAVLRST